MSFFSRYFPWFETKDSATGPHLALGSLGQPKWMQRNFDNFAKEGYQQNVIGYRSVRMIAENASVIPIIAKVNDREVDSHPVLDLLKRPNPFQAGPDFIDEAIAYWRIAGNGYLEAVDLRGEIRELYALRPDRMKAIPGARGYPVKWRYSVGGSHVDFDVGLPTVQQSPIMHLKDFNPLDDWYGQSPMEAGAFSIDTHNAAGGFNKALLDNSASPSGAFVMDGNGDQTELTDNQFKRLKGQMTKEYAGAKNAGKMMLLEGGLKWMQMGHSPKDLEFSDGKNQSAREVALAFGVPPQLLGIPGDNTYSNYKEANRAFHRQTVIPLYERFLRGIANWLQPTYEGLELEPNTDGIDALSEERESHWKRVNEADCLSVDEKREALGYAPYKPDPKRPTSYIMVSGSVMRIDDVLEDESGGAEPTPEEIAALEADADAETQE